MKVNSIWVIFKCDLDQNLLLSVLQVSNLDSKWLNFRIDDMRDDKCDDVADDFKDYYDGDDVCDDVMSKVFSLNFNFGFNFSSQGLSPEKMSTQLSRCDRF